MNRYRVIGSSNGFVYERATFDRLPDATAFADVFAGERGHAWVWDRYADEKVYEAERVKLK